MRIETEMFQLNDGHKIPSIGLGSWQMGELDEGDAMATLSKALEAGCRHFDIAFFHQSEKSIGKVFQIWFENGTLRREDLYIVSKLPPIGMWSYRVNEFLKRSLHDLGIEYLDLYLIEFPVGFQYTESLDLLPVNESGNILLDHQTHIEAIWKAMEREVRRGRTKSIGICNFNQSQLERILKSCQIPPAVIQMETNVYSQQKSLMSICDRHKIRMSAFNSLGSPRSRLTQDAEIHCLSLKYGKSSAQIAQRFLIQCGCIVVLKFTNPESVQENFQIFDFKIDNEDMELLRSLDQGVSGTYKLEIIYPGVETHPEYPWK